MHLEFLQLKFYIILSTYRDYSHIKDWQKLYSFASNMNKNLNNNKFKNYYLITKIAKK